MPVTRWTFVTKEGVYPTDRGDGVAWSTDKKLTAMYAEAMGAYLVDADEFMKQPTLENAQRLAVNAPPREEESSK